MAATVIKPSPLPRAPEVKPEAKPRESKRSSRAFRRAVCFNATTLPPRHRTRHRRREPYRHPHRIWRRLQPVTRYVFANTNDMASAIAFHGMIAVVPMFLLIVAVAGLLFRSEALFDTVTDIVRWVLPSEQAQDALEEAIAARRHAGWFGLASLIGFAWVGSSFLTTVGRALNRIYGVSDRRQIHQRLRSVVLLAVIGIVVAFVAVVGALPTLLIGREVHFLVRDSFVANSLWQLAGYAFSVLVSMLLFGLVYRFVPNVKQRLSDLWRGTLVASLGFVALVQVFPLYIRFVQAMPSSAYARAFLFATLLLTWFYLIAHLLLIGAWINARHWRARRGLPDTPRKDLFQSIPRPR